MATAVICLIYYCGELWLSEATTERRRPLGCRRLRRPYDSAFLHRMEFYPLATFYTIEKKEYLSAHRLIDSRTPKGGWAGVRY